MLARQVSNFQGPAKPEGYKYRCPQINVSSELLHEPNPGRSVGDFHQLDAEHGADNAGVAS